MSSLIVTPRYRTLVDDNGSALWLPAAALAHLSSNLDWPHHAVRVSEEELEALRDQHDARVASIRDLTDDARVMRAVALLRHREDFHFDPRTGGPLHQHETHATTPEGSMVFPRIDPAVIGIVELRGRNQILLGRNRLRPAYFSLIAGYVSPGETLEAAFAREVLEETGRRVETPTYLSSQSWPMTGSLMVGFHAFTEDEAPIQDPDEELAESRWAGLQDLDALPISPPGSIARTLIDNWISAQKEQA
ncbi:NUDIX domain-containing protein [Corynebacterium sp. H127]|uniref:NAD(+) diphosphatase n=1 Tax=Corynebacterium sp. H127 TaxID=3133418 RepID=UPI0030A08C38